METESIQRPDLVFAFCCGQLDHDGFFKGLQSVVGKTGPIVGGLTIGIITHDHLSYEGYPAVIQSDTIRHRVASLDHAWLYSFRWCLSLDYQGGGPVL